jgi:hypothetical protein
MMPDPGAAIDLLKDFSESVGLLELKSAIMGKFVM